MNQANIQFSSNDNTIKVLRSGTVTISVPAGGGNAGSATIDLSDISLTASTALLGYFTYQGNRYSLSGGSTITNVTVYDTITNFSATISGGIGTISLQRASSVPQNNNAISVTVKYFVLGIK
jgi:hypothetical protein